MNGKKVTEAHMRLDNGLHWTDTARTNILEGKASGH